MKHISINRAIENIAFTSVFTVFLTDLSSGIALALLESEKIKRARGNDAAHVPNSISRNKFSVKGNNAIPQSLAKSKATMNTTPSIRRVRIRSFNLGDTSRTPNKNYLEGNLKEEDTVNLSVIETLTYHRDRI